MKDFKDIVVKEDLKEDYKRVRRDFLAGEITEKEWTTYCTHALRDIMFQE
tara:strand:+ start:4683 stop:4832 length:150 start_codon:yes stop_codon:yes gene_type:complete